MTEVQEEGTVWLARLRRDSERCQIRRWQSYVLLPGVGCKSLHKAFGASGVTIFLFKCDSTLSSRWSSREAP